MDAKEKAIELVNRFVAHVHQAGETHHTIEMREKLNAIDCALICVDEIISDLKESFDVAKDLHPHAAGLIAGSLVFWKSVKSELELMFN